MKKIVKTIAILLIITVLFTACSSEDVLLKMPIDKVVSVYVENVETTDNENFMKTETRGISIEDKAMIGKIYEILNSKPIYSGLTQLTSTSYYGEINTLNFKSEIEDKTLLLSTNKNAISVISGDNIGYYGYEKMPSKEIDGEILYSAGEETAIIKNQLMEYVETLKEKNTDSIEYKFYFLNKDEDSQGKIDLGILENELYIENNWNSTNGGNLEIIDGKYYFKLANDDTMLTISFDKHIKQ